MDPLAAPHSLTAGYYSQHYRPLQWAKYSQTWSHLAPLLPTHSFSMLDLGVGPGWWEEYLSGQGVIPARAVGVDISFEAIQPTREDITYILDPAFQSKEQFDLVVCWDAFHLLQNKSVFDFVKPDGLLLVSEPPAFETKLEALTAQIPPLINHHIGEMERSRVCIFRKSR